MTDFLDRYPVGVDDGQTKEKKLSIPIEKMPELTKLARELAVAVSAFPLSKRGFILVLVSKWDAYVGELLRWVYRVRPEIIDGSTRSILFTDLKDMKSISAARDKIVDDEVAAVMRESHIEQFKYLRKEAKYSG